MQGPMSSTIDAPTFGMESLHVPGKEHLLGPLLSIHLTSNRPDQFVRFLDRLETSIDETSSVEVVIKIDDTDEAMNSLLEKEARIRPFRITYISTPLKEGFFNLWRSYDDLLRASHHDAYFVIGLNDEMHFKTKGWDSILRRYVGLFPDHIFRLRTSPHRSRNYYDFWEAGFANDTSAFMTKQWLEVGGGWCPCNGPDTYQQCIAYYFGWLDRFNAARSYREFAIYDIEFEGHGASTGLSGPALRRRIGGSLEAWFILMSHRMQQEAARRAQKLHAHIWTEENGASQFDIKDNRRRRRIEITNRQNGALVRALDYRLSPIRIWVTNTLRKLNCGYYLAGGANNQLSWYHNLMNYLALRYRRLDFWFDLYNDAHGARPDGKSLGYYFARRLLIVAYIWPKKFLSHLSRKRLV